MIFILVKQFFTAIFVLILFILHVSGVDYLDAYIYSTSNIATSDNVAFSQNSIGSLLLPNGFIEAILFGIVRTFAYIVSPLPLFIEPIVDVFHGKLGSWQTIFTLLTSFVYVATIPLVFSGLIFALCKGSDKRLLVFHMPYWITIFSVSFGNMIIHDRYRVMASMFYFISLWVSGLYGRKSIILKSYLAYLFFVFIALCLYAYVKL